jgi:hypothetical protein
MFFKAKLLQWLPFRQADSKSAILGRMIEDKAGKVAVQRRRIAASLW